ncbi:RNA polymerase sigma factor [Micromonospora chersina]|uniref:RNA polymerase sigma factor n=1 Tax=Micromonospora chersina TaxID=47854 RepID=UPI00371A9FDD
MDSKKTPSEFGSSSLDEGTPNDSDVEDRLRAGDNTAFAELYREHAGKMFSIAYRILGNREDSAEAVQQAFLQAWAASRRLDGRGDGLHGWLHTILHRAAIDLYRRERRHRANMPILEEGALAALVCHGPSLDEAWRKSQVHEALTRMPLMERQVLQLSYFHHMKQDEIATYLGIPVGTVKSRTFRAHNRLASLLNHLREEAAPTPPGSLLRVTRSRRSTTTATNRKLTKLPEVA